MRAAADAFRQRRNAAFRQGCRRERKALVDEAVAVQASVTLQDIVALEDQLRDALAHLGQAHDDAAVASADLTQVGSARPSLVVAPPPCNVA